MYEERVKNSQLRNRIMSATDAALLFKDGMNVGSSGFTRGGDSKVVLKALAERAKTDPIKISLMTGASLGHGTDGALATSHAMKKRLPFQADPVLRAQINSGDILFVDQHLGETAELLTNGFLPPVDIAVLEAAQILEDGSIVPTTSVGNNLTFANLADKVIIEVNTAIPLEIRGLHDIFSPGKYPDHAIIPITRPDSRIGTDTIAIDPKKIAAIVFTDIKDSPAELTAPDNRTSAIAAFLMEFFRHEVRMGRLTPSLLPLQAGIGKIANAVLSGFLHGEFHDLTMYSEVLQDSTFQLIDAGKMTFASASSLTVSEEVYNKFFNNLDFYRDKVVLRPQNISNAAEVIRRLGVIGINTAIEFDIYGNVNSTHIAGTKMMNGIGGSGDFSRNAYLSIFVTPSVSKPNNAISHVVPMVPHVDSNEHDVDILVTDQGIADLRGLAPRERAKVVIENCCHSDYRDYLKDYFREASQRGGHTPHLLEKAFNWHVKMETTGSMK